MIVEKTEEVLREQAKEIMNGRVKLSPKEYVLARNNEYSEGRLRVLQEKCRQKKLFHTAEGGRYFFYLTDVFLNLQKGL